MLYKGIFVSCCSDIFWSSSHKFCQSLSRRLICIIFGTLGKRPQCIWWYNAIMKTVWCLLYGLRKFIVTFACFRILTKRPSALCYTAYTRFIEGQNCNYDTFESFGYILQYNFTLWHLRFTQKTFFNQTHSIVFACCLK